MTKKKPEFDVRDWKLFTQKVKPLENRPEAEVPTYQKPPIKTKQSQKTIPLLKTASHQGGFKPQAKIDLHGYTETTVFEVLENFILRCIHQDVRCILIITGKGEVTPLAGTFLLRQEVPRFLESDKMKKYIVSIHSAPQHMGGQGAFIVQLRKKTKIHKTKI